VPSLTEFAGSGLLRCIPQGKIRVWFKQLIWLFAMRGAVPAGCKNFVMLGLARLVLAMGGGIRPIFFDFFTLAILMPRRRPSGLKERAGSESFERSIGTG
jgi:hypothetical protein